MSREHKVCLGFSRAFVCVFLVILVVAALLHFIVVFAHTPACCLLLLFLFRLEFIVLIVFLGDTHSNLSEAGLFHCCRLSLVWFIAICHKKIYT